MDDQLPVVDQSIATARTTSWPAIIWVLCSGGVLFTRMLLYYNKGSMFDPLITFGAGIVFTVTSIVILASSIGARKRKEQGIYRTPLRLVLSFALCVLVVACASRFRDTRPQRLTCLCAMMDFNGYSLTLYRNGNYQWKNWVFGMANYQWGRYTMKNDTVQLDVDSLENIVQTNKLLITKGHLFDTTVNEELCEQLCDSGKWAETMRVVRP